MVTCFQMSFIPSLLISYSFFTKAKNPLFNDIVVYLNSSWFSTFQYMPLAVGFRLAPVAFCITPGLSNQSCQFISACFHHCPYFDMPAFVSQCLLTVLSGQKYLPRSKNPALHNSFALKCNKSTYLAFQQFVVESIMIHKFGCTWHVCQGNSS